MRGLKLKELDIDFMKALETDNTSEKNSITSTKKYFKRLSRYYYIRFVPNNNRT